MTGWQGSTQRALGRRVLSFGLRVTGYRWPMTIFILLLLAFFHKMAFSNLILARGDTFLYFYPYWQAAAAALRDGRIPWWNPYLFMGSPLVANSQVGFFYPPNWPLWWWLETPYAVSASILLHLAIGGAGAYLAGRCLLGLERWAGLVTAVLFALGGYVTAQVEHINQLQGIAWLPWYLVVMGRCAADTRQPTAVKIGGATAAFSALFALQLLAGHTQTAFISGVTLLVWLGAELAAQRLLRQTAHELQFTFHWRRLKRHAPLALLLGGGLALLLTAVQLLPTWELTHYSSRQGGLPVNEVLSFSLSPLLLARALLPVYGQSLFSEYAAFLPMTAVVLAVIGAWQWRRWPGLFPAAILVAVGLFLALGAFNPANWLLARLPVFNLFRVPARWLVMVTLGLALLAGAGFQVVLYRYYQRARRWEDVPERARESLVHIERPLRGGIYLLVGLMAWNALAGFLVFFIPTGPEAPFEAVRPLTLGLWLAEIVLVYGVLTGERPVYARDGRFKLGVKRSRLRSPFWLLLIMVVTLFLASRTHPYHNLTTPEAYFDLRPPIARLQAAGCQWSVVSDACSPDRFLSLSNIFFDVGDQAEIDTIYADQLPEAARYDYTVAIKHKEVIGPNLPMTFGLAAVDGFDGGILPLRSYSELMRLILPAEAQTTDGRLREHLTAVPDARWLDLFNARFLITDKTGDVWRQTDVHEHGVYFDLQHPLTLAAGESFTVAHTPPFPASALLMLVEGEPGVVQLTTAAGEMWQLAPFTVDNGLMQASAPLPTNPSPAQALFTPRGITFQAGHGEWRLLAATLLNGADGTFMPLTLGHYRLIYSGDVKIYENLDVLPRAFMVHDWQWQPDVPTSVAVMKNEAFDPGQTAVLVAQNLPVPSPTPSAGQADRAGVEIIGYEPEGITLRTDSDTEGFLLLTEAFYPGWQASVDGRAAPIYQADGYFQGVFVPAGTHQVRFAFVPGSFGYGRLFSLAGLALWFTLIGALGVHYYGHKQRKSP